MRSILLAIFCCFLAACGSAPRPASENVTANTAAPAAANERPQTAIAHTTEGGVPPASTAGGEKSKWTSGGDPIDTAALDADVAKAEKAGDKKELSQAYLKRADALTKARQYAAALGDYRRALKTDPSNADAKNWIEQITMVYDSMNREAPKEGEEPGPLPFKKQ